MMSWSRPSGQCGLFHIVCREGSSDKEADRLEIDFHQGAIYSDTEGIWLDEARFVRWMPLTGLYAGVLPWGSMREHQ
jgi:hypothetical protein